MSIYGMLDNLVLAFIGFAGGIAVGSGLLAFLIVLDIIPRLAQLTSSYRHVAVYEAAIITGSLYFTVTDLLDLRLSLSPVGTMVIGLLAGVFVGMLAAALTEVLNVLPILAKRLRVEPFMVWLLLAMVLGKVAGSLFDWLVFYQP